MSNKRVILSSVALPLFWAAPASAQQLSPAPADPAAASTVTTEAPAESDADIVITGIRRSLADAATIKRDSVTVSDVISAEDIGKFPDQNLAESLQRVTGVQITRNRGEGQLISVRGLAPDLTRTTYNGRVLATPTGTRAFSFTSLTSDFVSSVEVTKSPTADMIEGGLSATVDVRTRRPLAIGKNAMSFIAEGVYEESSGQMAPHFGGQITHIFADGALGVNLGLAYEGRKARQVSQRGYGLEKVQESTRTPPIDYNDDGVIPAAGTPQPTYLLNHGFNNSSEDTDNQRITAVATIEANPTANLNLYLDGFYSKFLERVADNQYAVRFTNIRPARPGAPYGVVNSTINSQGVITYLDADGVDHRAQRILSDRDSTTFSGAIGGKLDLGALALSTELTYSRAEAIYNALDFNVTSRASVAYDIRNDITAPTGFTYSRGYDPLDPSTYNAVGVAITHDQPNTDRNYDGRLDATWRISDTGLLRSIKVGGYMGDHRNTYIYRFTNVGSALLSRALNLPFQPTVESGSVNFAGYVKPIVREGYIPTLANSWLIVDTDKFLKALPISKALELAPIQPQPARDYTITEKVIAAYARADFQAADGDLAGNIGIRYVRTRQTSFGNAPDLDGLVLLQGDVFTLVPAGSAVAVRNDYANWLPSLNVRYNLSDDLVLRFAAARAMTRPDLNVLRPALSVNANIRNINSGNPLTRPNLADQLDLSLERYIGRAGLISVALFYKDLKNFVINGITNQSLTLRREAGGTVTLPFSRYQPVNSVGPKVRGVEAGIQLPLTFLPGFLDGLGVVSNVTFLDADTVTITQGQPKQPAPGLSKYSYTLGGFYEKDGFGIRGSYNYRSRFNANQQDSFGDRDFAKAYGQLDVSASYDLNAHFSLNADLTNALNARQEKENGIGVLRTISVFGRRYTAGVRAKF